MDMLDLCETQGEIAVWVVFGGGGGGVKNRLVRVSVRVRVSQGR